jgi:hypothetical protein
LTCTDEAEGSGSIDFSVVSGNVWCVVHMEN